MKITYVKVGIKEGRAFAQMRYMYIGMSLQYAISLIVGLSVADKLFQQRK